MNAGRQATGLDTPMREESKLLTNVLQPAAEAAGLREVTWHQFRHIHSPLLSDLKVPVKIAHEQLGHASISTTLNIYTQRRVVAPTLLRRFVSRSALTRIGVPLPERVMATAL